jgi:hypothetical protein
MTDQTQEAAPQFTPDELRVILELIDLGVRQTGRASLPVLGPLGDKVESLLR